MRHADQRDELVLQRLGVLHVVLVALAPLPAVARAVGGLGRCGPGVVVRREQDEVLARHPVPGLDPVGDAVGERAAEGDDVAGDEQDPMAAHVGQGQGLGGERVRHPL